MRHFPIFIDTQDKTIVFAGAGHMAIPKIRLLLKTEARLVVFADPKTDTVGEEIRRWSAQGDIVWAPRRLEAADLSQARLLYIASNDRRAAAEARLLADQAGVLASPVDSKTDSDFFTPALVDRDPVVVAIGTGGTAPILARRLKAQIENVLSPSLGKISQVAGRLRRRAKVVPHGEARRGLWSRYFDKAEDLPADKLDDATLIGVFDEALKAADAASRGSIALVGAGPGDPDLLTVKARNRLFDADVVLHDRLVDLRILDLARREARFIETGKAAGQPGWSQDAINAAMIREVRAGHRVVRLKSGDPLVFGRADEELDALEAAGITAEIVPGITSAAAAASSIGRSLTRRDRNSAITFITGQDAKGFAEQEWRSLARPGAVFAIYMGVRTARFVQGRLLIHGADAATPVTIVENASRADERRVSGTLGALTDLMEAEQIKGPAILFVGLAARDAASGSLATKAPVAFPHAPAHAVA